MQKSCKACETIFYKKPSDSIKYWTVKTYCSKKCANREPKIISEETKRKMSVAHKGKKLPKRPSQQIAPKICKTCEAPFFKRATESKPHFINRKFCSNKCIHHGRVISESTRKKMGLSRMGKKLPKRTKEWVDKLSKRMQGTKRSDETKAKMRASQLKRVAEGKHNCWKGGVTPANRAIRVSAEYKEWRVKVYERDGHKCIWCGAKSQKDQRVYLHADHIKPFAYYPELRFDVDNGRTLCAPCHKQTGTYGWGAYNQNKALIQF